MNLTALYLHYFLSAGAFSLLIFASMAQYIGKPSGRHVILSFIFSALSVLVVYPFLISVGQIELVSRLNLLHVPAISVAAISTFLIFRLMVEERDLGPTDFNDLALMLAIVVSYTFFSPNNGVIAHPTRFPFLVSTVSAVIAMIYLFRGIRMAPSLLNQSRRSSILSPILVGVGLIHIGFSVLIPVLPNTAIQWSLAISAMSNVITIGVAMIHFRYPALLPNWLMETQQHYKRRYYLGEINVPDVVQKLEYAMKIDQIYAQPTLTLDTLAAYVGISRYQLSQLLNRELKLSFTRYIQQFRVEAACRVLLSAPHRTILSVAFDVGFNSLSAFQTAFKGVTGMTPSEYRKQKSQS